MGMKTIHPKKLLEGSHTHTLMNILQTLTVRISEKALLGKSLILARFEDLRLHIL